MLHPDSNPFLQLFWIFGSPGSKCIEKSRSGIWSLRFQNLGAKNLRTKISKYKLPIPNYKGPVLISGL